jgi:hypothetical protein
MVSRGGLQALPQAWSAVSKVQSALRADTERIQSDGERRRTPGAPTGLERGLKSSKRTPSGYRADTCEVRFRRTVRHWFEASKSSELFIKYKMEFSMYEERWKLVVSARKRLCCALLSSLCTTTQSKGPLEQLGKARAAALAGGEGA